MAEPGQNDYPGFYELLSQLQRTPPSAFNILPSSPDRERTHTRFLRWLFSPYENHHADRGFLRSFLSACELSILADSVHTVSAFEKIDVSDLETKRTDRDEAELDLIIKAPDHVVGVVIKTRGRESPEKFYDEYLALQHKYNGMESQMVYVPPREHRGFKALVGKEGVPEARVTIVPWQELIDLLRPLTGEAENPYVAGLITDFLSTAESSIIESYPHPPPGALLRMIYPEKCQEAGVFPDASQSWEDYRSDLFHRIIVEFDDEHGDDWEHHSPNGRIAFFRPTSVWPDNGFNSQSYPPVSIQVLTQNERFVKGSSIGAEDQPFIEVTLTSSTRRVIEIVGGRNFSPDSLMTICLNFLVQGITIGMRSETRSESWMPILLPH